MDETSIKCISVLSTCEWVCLYPYHHWNKDQIYKKNYMGQCFSKWHDRIVTQCNFFQWIIYWAPIIAVNESFQSSLTTNCTQTKIFTNITFPPIFILSIARADHAIFFFLLISALIFGFLFVNQPQFVKMATERNQFVSSHIVDSILALIKVH